MMRAFIIYFICISMGLIGGTPLRVHAMEGKPQGKLPTITLKVGQAPRIVAEVARKPGEMAMGLMFRKSMGDNEGMLFVFERERRASFWMANTFIPLTIAYLDREGTILELHDMKPQDMSPVLSKSDRVAFALEMNRGWFKLNGVKAGEKIMPVNTTWDRLRKPTARQPQYDR
jgi:uncharacterized membrane protein (UPF0127 family)